MEHGSSGDEHPKIDDADRIEPSLPSHKDQGEGVHIIDFQPTTSPCNSIAHPGSPYRYAKPSNDPYKESVIRSQKFAIPSTSMDNRRD